MLYRYLSTPFCLLELNSSLIEQKICEDRILFNFQYLILSDRVRQDEMDGTSGFFWPKGTIPPQCRTA
jgi:hypothetical protein